MGSVLGPVVGAAGSIIGGMQSADASKKAALIQAAAQDRAGERALTGYKYLTEGAGAQPMNNYINAGQTALTNQGSTQNLMMDLLGISNYANQGGGGPTQPAAPATAPAPAAPNALGGNIPAFFQPQLAAMFPNGGQIAPGSVQTGGLASSLGIPAQAGQANAFAGWGGGGA